MTNPRRPGPMTIPAGRPPCPPGCDGSTHPRCRSHNGAGQWCGVAPIKGGTVCQSHGGMAPQVRAAAARRAETAALELAVRRELGTAAAIGNPLERILQLAGEVCEWLAALRDRAQERLDADRLIVASESGQSIALEISLYERALDRAAHVLNLAASKDIEARLTAVAERDMAAILAAIEAAYRAGSEGLTMDEARQRITRHLAVVQP